MQTVSKDELDTLVGLLERRLTVIADHALRESNAEEQLRQLQEVSERIIHYHDSLKGRLSPRLAHFLDNCSYEKALARAREEMDAL